MFYHYSQNNSGGSFHFDKAAGITVHVVVEADSAQEADTIAELFKQCMSILPKGPEHVVNSNDWDEVVNSCESAAYYQSVRAYSAIKQECRNQ